MQLFLAGSQYFRRLRADENTIMIFVGLASQRKDLTYFHRPAEPTKIFPLFSSADENSVIFVGNPRKSAYFRLFYSIGLISSADRQK
jgi:hypothetical protein